MWKARPGDLGFSSEDSGVIKVIKVIDLDTLERPH